MVREFLERLRHRLLTIVTQPHSELTRWQRAARFLYDLARYGARQLQQDNAPQMAAALAFRTLFGMLPVVVVGTILVRAFRGKEGFEVMVAALLGKLGLDIPINSLQGSELATPAVSTQTLSEWLMSVVRRAEEINLAALGWVGVAVLIYAAIGLMVTIEQSFNTVYRAPTGRPWVRRVPVYWTILTLSSLALGLLVYLDARFNAAISTIGTWQWAVTVAHAAWGLAVTWVVLLALYLLIPNTSVALRPAIIGAAVAAVMVGIGKHIFGTYLSNILAAHLWGSVGLIPIFMFWVYLMWLAVLFGLEVSAGLQMLRGHRMQELKELEERSRPAESLIDPACVVPVMEVIAVEFRQGRAAPRRLISETACVPEQAVESMLCRLCEAGFVDRLADGSATLARPPEEIRADQLIEIGFQMVGVGGGSSAPASGLLDRLRSAQRTAAAQVTLGQLG